MEQLLKKIRKAVETSGKSRYRIARESGLAQSQLSRLISGKRGLSLEALVRLADCLGLEVVIRPKRRRKGG